MKPGKEAYVAHETRVGHSYTNGTEPSFCRVLGEDRVILSFVTVATSGQVSGFWGYFKKWIIPGIFFSGHLNISGLLRSRGGTRNILTGG